MTNLPPSRTADRIIIRLPDGMRDRLHARAEANGRSLTAEVVDMLERAMGSDGRERLETLRAKLETMRARRESLSRGMAELEIQERVLETELAVLSTDLAAIEQSEEDYRKAAAGRKHQQNPAKGKLPE